VLVLTLLPVQSGRGGAAVYMRRGPGWAISPPCHAGVTKSRDFPGLHSFTGFSSSRFILPGSALPNGWKHVRF